MLWWSSVVRLSVSSSSSHQIEPSLWGGQLTEQRSHIVPPKASEGAYDPIRTFFLGLHVLFLWLSRWKWGHQHLSGIVGGYGTGQLTCRLWVVPKEKALQKRQPQSRGGKKATGPQCPFRLVREEQRECFESKCGRKGLIHFPCLIRKSFPRLRSTKEKRERIHRVLIRC